MWLLCFRPLATVPAQDGARDGEDLVLNGPGAKPDFKPSRREMELDEDKEAEKKRLPEPIYNWQVRRRPCVLVLPLGLHAWFTVVCF